MVDATCDETRILDFQHGGGALDTNKDRKADQKDEKIQKSSMLEKTLNDQLSQVL